MASAVLWNDIDDYLAAAAASDFALPAAQVIQGEKLDLDAAIHPAVLVHGAEARTETIVHTGGPLSAENHYSYYMAATFKGDTWTQAKAGAKTQQHTLLKLLLSRPGLGGLTATDGERVTSVELTDSWAEVYESLQDEHYLGIGYIGFTVNTETA